MTRFLGSLLASLAAVMLIGGIVIAELGARTDGATTPAARVLGQAEDDEMEGDEANLDGSAQGSAIDQLLLNLAPPGEGTGLPSAQRVLLSRDPFRPVIPDSTSEPGGGATDGGAGGGGTTDGGSDGDGGTDGDGSGGDGAVTACGGDEAEAVCDGVVITLDGFTEDGLALVTVDGTTFTVGQNDDFATSLRVLAVNDPCVTLLYGDESFSICVGATVLK